MKKKSTFFRIDEQVFFTLAGLCVVSLILIAFRFATRNECSPITIRIKNDSLLAGRRIVFQALTKGGKQFSWDFGDSTILSEQLPSASHVYKTPGIYLVRVLVDEKCSEIQEIQVLEDRPVTNLNLQPDFVMPMVAYVNEPFVVEDTSSSAKAWEWSFEQNGPVESSKRRVSYTYFSTGVKVITLKVDGRNDLTFSRSIMVMEKEAKMDEDEKRARERPKRPAIIVNENPEIGPLITQIDKDKKEEEIEPPKPAPKPKVRDVSRDQLESLLLEVSKGSKWADDLSDFICNTSDKIGFEGKSYTLVELCEQLKKEKRVKKVIASYEKMAETNCIKIVSISVKKRLF